MFLLKLLTVRMGIDLTSFDMFLQTVAMHAISWGKYIAIGGAVWAACEFLILHNMKRGIGATFCVIIGILLLLVAPSWAGIS